MTTYIGTTVNTLYERFHASGSGHLHTNNVDSALLNHTNKSGDLCTVHLMQYHNLYQELNSGTQNYNSGTNIVQELSTDATGILLVCNRFYTSYL